jgi:hypothetical protein
MALADLTARQAEDKEDMRSKDAEIAELQQKLGKRPPKVDATEEQTVAHELVVEAFMAELEICKTELETVQAAHKEKVADLQADMKEKLNSSNEELASKTRELDACKDNLHASEEKVKVADGLNADIKQKLEAAEDRNADLTKKLERESKQHTVAKKALNESQNTLEISEEKLKESQKEVEASKKELEAAQAASLVASQEAQVAQDAHEKNVTDLRAELVASQKAAPAFSEEGASEKGTPAPKEVTPAPNGGKKSWGDITAKPSQDAPNVPPTPPEQYVVVPEMVFYFMVEHDEAVCRALEEEFGVKLTPIKTGFKVHFAGKPERVRKAQERVRSYIVGPEIYLPKDECTAFLGEKKSKSVFHGSRFMMNLKETCRVYPWVDNTSKGKPYNKFYVAGRPENVKLAVAWAMVYKHVEGPWPTNEKDSFEWQLYDNGDSSLRQYQGWYPASSFKWNKDKEMFMLAGEEWNEDNEMYMLPGARQD